MYNSYMTKNASALYIHIPFCVKKCAYCDFASYENYDLQEAYFDALKNEILIQSKKWGKNVFDTIFIGGGTPSSVESYYISDTLERAYKALNIDLKEATIEVNPGTVDAEKLGAYRNMGINRISFGMQAAQDDILKAVGRIHTFSQAKDSVAIAKTAGFDNISIDLMSGLPGQSADNLIESVEITAKMGVSHISMYTLKLEEGTPLFTAVKNGQIILPDKDTEYEMSKAARERIVQLGYNRYEISNYAKDDKTCAHNLHYWHNDDYLGVGVAGASSKLGLRSMNTRGIKEYIDIINIGEMPYTEHAQSSEEEYAFETLMLGLRLVEGVNIVEYYIRHGIQLDKRFGELIVSLARRSLISLENDVLTLTEKGMDVQNSVLVEFMEGFDF